MEISLRGIEESDLVRIAELANDKEIARVAASLPYPYTAADARTWYDYLQANRHEHVFAICADGKMAGVIGLVHEAAHSRAELGYWLGRAYWGKGYASAAAEMMVGYAFASLGVNKVYANCFAVNTASRRVLQKCGLKHEGTQRRHHVRMGQTHDVLLFGLLKEDYDAHR